MNVPPESSAAFERATLRLARGISKHSAWLLCNGCGSSLITIGADASSDWRILAPGMAGYAMSIGFVDGVLCACSGPHSRVTMDGRPLSELLEKITGPVTLALGMAEVALTYDAAMEPAPRNPARGRATWPDTPGWNPEPHRSSPDVELCVAEQAWRAPHIDAPTLLGREPAPQSRDGSLRRIAFAASAAVSYVAWLYLLDHF